MAEMDLFLPVQAPSELIFPSNPGSGMIAHVPSAWMVSGLCRSFTEMVQVKRLCQELMGMRLSKLFIPDRHLQQPFHAPSERALFLPTLGRGRSANVPLPGRGWRVHLWRCCPRSQGKRKAEVPLPSPPHPGVEEGAGMQPPPSIQEASEGFPSSAVAGVIPRGWVLHPPRACSDHPR